MDLIGLALATIVLGLSPGPAVFATISRALSQSLKQTYLFIAGITLGDLVFSLIAMLGLAAAAASNTAIFVFLKILGGGYLIYIGVKNFLSIEKPEFHFKAQEKGYGIILSGFLLTASNPKDLLFFIGFLPIFIDLTDAGFKELTLASVVIVISFLMTLSVYALSANAAKKLFQTPAALKKLRICAGTLMIIAGLYIILN